MKYLAIILFAIFFTACTTDFECSCTGAGIDFTNQITGVTQADAEDMCAETEADAEANSNGIDVTCVLSEF